MNIFVNDLDVVRLKRNKKTRGKFPLALLGDRLPQDATRPSVDELDVCEVARADSLPQDAVSSLVQRAERVLRQVAGRGVDLARVVDEQGESVAIVGSNEVGITHSMYSLGVGRYPYSVTIIPHNTEKVNRQI